MNDGSHPLYRVNYNAATGLDLIVTGGLELHCTFGLSATKHKSQNRLWHQVVSDCMPGNCMCLLQYDDHRQGLRGAWSFPWTLD